MSEHVTLVEVGPRDGLQSEKHHVPASIKIELIEQLAQAGCPVIECTSFTSAKWIPQLADHSEVMQGITRHKGVRYPVLVPNVMGLQQALAVQVDEIAIFTAVSETFNKKNINATIAESLVRLNPVVQLAKQHKLRIRAYVSCVFGCPYEGKIALETIIPVIEQLLQWELDDIAISDTIGVATPLQTRNILKAITAIMPVERIAVHFHDTYGMAIANIVSALDAGVRIIDSSVAGLGGCPYAVGASGNVASEEVVYLLENLGFSTGIDLDSLIRAGEYICQHIGLPNRSKVAKVKTTRGNHS